MLLISSLFYFRIPRERWEERMKLLKTAGYHGIDVYFPWNYHETAPGNWNFENNRDIEKFLELAARNELFVIARPGPYICSEWDGGGIPAWLWERNIAVRQDDQMFLHEMQRWYEHILPIISKYQIGNKGTVICMQIENELDFYRCISPVSYMEKLKEMAEELGIKVPLFYCCGQNDLLRGGGLTPGLYTAFNVYSDKDYIDLEKRASHLYNSVYERNMPFLVTETNREHGYLKRLLACGAKLLSPYNQTAGCTMDYYNGITNWGTQDNPIALMASDYDFESMIGSAGEINEQYAEARMLSGMIHTWGRELAEAIPNYNEDIEVHTDNRRNSLIPVLVMRRGKLIELTDLGSGGIWKVRYDNNEIQVLMKAFETKLLPWNIQVDETCEINFSNYEIGWISEEDGRKKVCLYGEGALECKINGKYGECIIYEKNIGDGYQFFYGNILFIVGSLKNVAFGHIPGLPDMKNNFGEQKKTGKVDEVFICECELGCNESRKRVQQMEKMGQYRGIGRYRIRVPEDGEYLFADAADLITVENGGEKYTLFSNGGCFIRKLKKGEADIYTEIWGHSNFDDIRCPSLQMGSLKGISGLVRVNRKEDITENWMFDLDDGVWNETCFFRHSPYNTIMGIDGYNRAVSPLNTIYTRVVFSGDKEDALFLQFERADCMIGVYVNNRYVGMVEKRAPYVDLSEYAGSGRIEITLRTIRRYYTDLVGKITMIGGQKITDCMYGEAIPMSHGKMRECQLPHRFEKGEETFLNLKIYDIQENDLKLYFKGQDIKLTVYAGGHVVGRILLQEDEMPVVAGGCREVVYLCREWCDDIRIWCQAIGKNPELEKILVEEYGSII